MTKRQSSEYSDLPDVGNFPPFQSLAPDGKTIRDPAPGSYVVSDFVFSKKRWDSTVDRSASQTITPPPSNRKGLEVRSMPSAWTLERILSESIQDWQCLICGEKGDKCLGVPCVQDFRLNSQNALGSLEIRDTGKTQYGVYCKGARDQYIPAGSILGEYIGEILPPNTNVNEVLKNDAYGFRITGIGYVTAKTYGNWTRFVNHTCVENNVMTRKVMYGKRLVMAFIAKTDIFPGDQLYSNYGRQYFINMDSKCVCNDWDENSAPHLPPTSEELQTVGRVPAPAPEVIDTLANLRQLRNVAPSSDAHPSAFNESRTFEIDVSAGGNFVTTREFTIPRSALTGAGGSKTIEIDLVLRRRGGRGGGVTKSATMTTARASGQKSAGENDPGTSAKTPKNLD